MAKLASMIRQDLDVLSPRERAHTRVSDVPLPEQSAELIEEVGRSAARADGRKEVVAVVRESHVPQAPEDIVLPEIVQPLTEPREETVRLSAEPRIEIVRGDVDTQGVVKPSARAETEGHPAVAGISEERRETLREEIAQIATPRPETERRIAVSEMASGIPEEGKATFREDAARIETRVAVSDMVSGMLEERRDTLQEETTRRAIVSETVSGMLEGRKDTLQEETAPVEAGVTGKRRRTATEPSISELVSKELPAGVFTGGEPDNPTVIPCQLPSTVEEQNGIARDPLENGLESPEEPVRSRYIILILLESLKKTWRASTSLTYIMFTQATYNENRRRTEV
jgi:hypothetical protein